MNHFKKLSILDDNFICAETNPKEFLYARRPCSVMRFWWCLNTAVVFFQQYIVSYWKLKWKTHKSMTLKSDLDVRLIYQFTYNLPFSCGIFISWLLFIHYKQVIFILEKKDLAMKDNILLSRYYFLIVWKIYIVIVYFMYNFTMIILIIYCKDRCMH